MVSIEKDSGTTLSETQHFKPTNVRNLSTRIKEPCYLKRRLSFLITCTVTILKNTISNTL